VSAAVVGLETESPAAEIAAYSLAKVIRVEHPLLTPYTADGFILAFTTHRKERPAQVVFPHTYQVRDYAPALAARFARFSSAT